MAAAPDPDEVFCSTSGKDNFQRISRLLINGGTTLFREVFDQICPPFHLPTKLNDPATKNQLRAAKITNPQESCLYPSPGTYGKSEDFDITLLFCLLRKICNLTPPATGWDVLPAPADHSLAANLARIKHYRNKVYSHVNRMELTDDEFQQLWEDIRGALIGIAEHLGPGRKCAWQKAIDNFLTDALSAEDERNVQELKEWHNADLDLKMAVNKLAEKIDKVLERVEQNSKEAGQIQLFIECLTTRSDQRRESLRNAKTRAEDVLSLAAELYLKNVQPSTEEEHFKFLDYLKNVRGLLFVDAKEGSLIITVVCKSVQILDDLWADYCTGRVTAMAQKYLVTEKVLNTLGLTEAELSTRIEEKEYRNCREQLSAHEELDQKIQWLKHHQYVLHNSFLKWTQTRKETRSLLSKFVERAQESEMSYGKAPMIGTFIAGVVFAAVNNVIVGLFICAWIYIVLIFFKENPRRPTIVRDKRALHKASSDAGHLQRSVTDLAAYCRKNTQLALSSRVMAREYPFFLEILRSPRSTGPYVAKLSALIRKESNALRHRLRWSDARLSEYESNLEEAKEISQEILQELCEGPNEEEINGMILDFIKEKFWKGNSWEKPKKQTKKKYERY